MKIPQGWEEWPFSPGMFPDLLKLPEGEPRRIGVAALKARYAKRLWIHLPCWALAYLTLFGLGSLHYGGRGVQAETRLLDSTFGLLLATLGFLIVMFLPVLLLTRSLRRELAQMIAEGELWKCAECSYMLKGSTGDRCPECGEPIPDDIKAMIRPFAKRNTGL